VERSAYPKIMKTAGIAATAVEICRSVSRECANVSPDTVIVTEWLRMGAKPTSQIVRNIAVRVEIPAME